jgi:hypothetical protein
VRMMCRDDAKVWLLKAVWWNVMNA